MISGIDLSATFDYTLKRDTVNPTIWKLGVIPSYLMARISSEAKDNEIETTFKLLQLSLRGWENFDVPFEVKKEKIFGRELEVVPMSLIDRISLNDVAELSTKIMEINNLSGEEIKN